MAYADPVLEPGYTPPNAGYAPPPPYHFLSMRTVLYVVDKPARIDVTHYSTRAAITYSAGSHRVTNSLHDFRCLRLKPRFDRKRQSCVTSDDYLPRVTLRGIITQPNCNTKPTVTVSRREQHANADTRSNTHWSLVFSLVPVSSFRGARYCSGTLLISGGSLLGGWQYCIM